MRGVNPFSSTLQKLLGYERRGAKWNEYSPQEAEAIRARIAEGNRSAWRRGRYTARPPGGGNFAFSGATTGELFAAILVPCGYIREYQLQWGTQYERYKLDFAHLQVKVNIELDGPGHFGLPAEDRVRDSRLRALGWRVIRIKHD